MRFSGKLVLRVAAIGLTVGAVVVPATAAHATAPSITVTPSTLLSNGQTVSVTGSNFANATHSFTLVECSAVGTPTLADCDISHLGGGTTGADGSIAATDFVVHTGAIGTNGGTCPTTVAGASCLIAASTDGGASDNAAYPISFRPVISAKPHSGLKNGQTVKVSGYGFPKTAEGVALAQCSAAADPDSCDTLHPVLSSTDATGQFTDVAFPVETGTVGNGKCKPGGTCYIAATTDLAGQGADQAQDGVTAITFADLPAPKPTKTVAHYAKKHHKFLGKVTSGGTGVKGLTTKLERRKAGNWKLVDKLTTRKGGKFSDKVTKPGTYKFVTPKQGKYLGSHSDTIKVHASLGSAGGGSS
jgi:hypothetical protein